MSAMLTTSPSLPYAAPNSRGKKVLDGRRWPRELCKAQQEFSLKADQKLIENGQSNIKRPRQNTSGLRLLSNKEQKAVQFTSPLFSACYFLKSQPPAQITTQSTKATLKSTDSKARHSEDSCFLLLPSFMRNPLALRAPQTTVQLRDIRLLHKPLRIQGDIALRNVAFEKAVTVRHSRDLWKTWDDSPAIYVGQYAGILEIYKFRFDIQLSMDGRSSCGAVLSVKYSIEGREFWDNKDGRNYDITQLEKYVFALAS